MTTHEELIKKANEAIKEFGKENVDTDVEESIHIEWVIRDAEKMIKALKDLLPEVKRME